MEHPEYVYSHFKKFLSEWGEANLRQEVAIYRDALQAIALEEDDEKARLIARQALVDWENKKEKLA